MTAPDALRRLHASAAAWLARAAEPRAAAEALLRAHPGWTAPAPRVALYAEFVFQHVRSALEQVHPLTHEAAGAGWDDLVRAWYDRRPARSFDKNALCEGFHALVQERLDGGAPLPAWLGALARFEWAELAVARSAHEVPRVAPARALNPTLEALEHGWRLVPWRERPAPRGAPEAGQELVLLWRHPRTLKANWLAANARALLAIKLVAEGTALEEAARAGGVDPAEVQAALRDAIGHGIVVPSVEDA